MVYLSLFFNQVELTGNSIFEYIHNYDQDEMNAILSLHPHINQHPVSRASVFPQSPLKHLKMFALSFFLSPSLSLPLSLPCIHPTLTCTHATGRLSQLPTARPDAHAHRQSQWRPASIRLRPRSRIAHHRDREDLLPAHEVRPGQKERGPHHLRI